MMKETVGNILLRSKWEHTRNQSFSVPWFWSLRVTRWQALVFTVQTALPGHLLVPAADLRAVVIIVSSHCSHLGLGQTQLGPMHQAAFSFVAWLDLFLRSWHILTPSPLSLSLQARAFNDNTNE